MISTFMVHSEPFTAGDRLFVKTPGRSGHRKLRNSKLDIRYLKLCGELKYSEKEYSLIREQAKKDSIMTKA
jgi:hypothetical protein